MPELGKVVAMASSGDVNGVRAWLSAYPGESTTTDILLEAAMVLAARNGHAKVVEVLVNEGNVSAGVRDSMRKDAPTILMIAAEKGHTHMVYDWLGTDRVLDKQDEMEAVDAALRGHFGLVQFFLEHRRVDPREIRRVIEVGALKGRTDLVSTTLHEHYPTLHRTVNWTTALNNVVMRGHADVLRVLIEYGVQPLSACLFHMMNFTYESLIAATEGHADILHVALEYDAVDLSIQSNSYRGSNALMEAVKYGQVDVVRTLLEHGAPDLYAYDHAGNTVFTLSKRQVSNARAIQSLLLTFSGEDDSICDAMTTVGVFDRILSRDL